MNTPTTLWNRKLNQLTEEEERSRDIHFCVVQLSIDFPDVPAQKIRQAVETTAASMETVIRRHIIAQARSLLGANCARSGETILKQIRPNRDSNPLESSNLFSGSPQLLEAGVA